jgi:hypothetical protein
METTASAKTHIAPEPHDKHMRNVGVGSRKDCSSSRNGTEAVGTGLGPGGGCHAMPLKYKAHKTWEVAVAAGAENHACTCNLWKETRAIMQVKLALGYTRHAAHSGQEMLSMHARGQESLP